MTPLSAVEMKTPLAKLPASHAWNTPLVTGSTVSAHDTHSVASRGFRPLVIPPMTYDDDDDYDDRDYDLTSQNRFTPQQPPIMQGTSHLFDISNDFTPAAETPPPASTVRRAPLASDSNRVMSI
jgi:hypothetical protein